jgi:hypothetical protein
VWPRQAQRGRTALFGRGVGPLQELLDGAFGHTDRAGDPLHRQGRTAAIPKVVSLVVVDDVSVSVPRRAVAMGMAVRLRSFPALLLVLMVLVMDMPVVVAHLHMRMLDNDRVARQRA